MRVDLDLLPHELENPEPRQPIRRPDRDESNNNSYHRVTRARAWGFWLLQPPQPSH